MFGPTCGVRVGPLLSDRNLLRGPSITGEWGSTDTSLTILPRESCEQLSEVYLIRTETEVFSFLARNTELLDVLFEIPHRIEPYFGGTPLFLEYIPGDIDADAGFLLVRIAVRNSVKSARGKLHEFGEGWWLEEWVRIDSKITIDIEAQ